ncbi:hypothetical protein [Actinomadura violacea]|uniref:Uncharacterized protein n=1 Tax=Actinomadura violacea TaxID=2819934 RepID=A0ABS3RU92_9ACTN|nr:hypothetical protein [Actinomadura violacea]MBO2460336.1 hypothetical protein [Actinomadura violacea]
MALYCVVSPGGSPGATSTALGLSLTWPGRVLLAECDPTGRRVLPGFMADRMRESAGPGLLGLAMAADAQTKVPLPLDDYVVPIADEDRVELLHGVRDPRHGSRLEPLWHRLAEAAVARDGDVIADLGKIGCRDTPTELLRAARAVVMVLKPTLPQVDAATPRVNALKEMLGDRATIGLCLVTDGPYGAAEVERVLDAPVLGELPYSPSDARVLSDGARPRVSFRTSLLMRSLARLGRRIRATEAEVADSVSSAQGAVL